MPREAMGTTQVKEILFSKQEIVDILLENFKKRAGTPYDFDYDRPIVLWHSDGSLIFRFVQREVTRETKPRAIQFKTLKV